MSSPIIIREVTVRHCAFAQKTRGAYTGGEVDPDTVFLFVTASDGRETGYGECVATSLMYPEGHVGRVNIDEWKTLLDICRRLPGQDALKLGRLIPDGLRSYDTNSSVDAVDFALHDLVGRRLGVPVSVLLGGIAKPFVWAMPVVYTNTPERMAANADEWYRQYGFRYFKLKPIGELEADVETLCKMRERTGPEVRFYMDAGSALKITPEKAVIYINELYKHGLAVYEDPGDQSLEGFRYIRERVEAEIMLDEKARDNQAVMEIVQARCADMINIHANWAGGFQSGIQRAMLAGAGGMAVMIGSTYYLGPGAAAYQVLSSVLPGDIPCEQVYMEVYGMKSFISDPYEIRDGKIFIRNAPGLGVTPDMAAIDKITVKKEVFS